LSDASDNELPTAPVAGAPEGARAENSKHWAARLLDRLGIKAVAVVGTVVTVVVTLVVQRVVPPVLDWLSPSSHRPPLSVTVVPTGEFLPTDPLSGDVWVLPMQSGTAPDDFPWAAEPAEQVAWATAREAVPGGHQTVRLILRGRSDDPLIIMRVTVVPVERVDALPGWYWRDGAGGELPVRKLIADVDCADASALMLDVEHVPEDWTAPPVADDLQGTKQVDLPTIQVIRPVTLQVSRSDVEQIDLSVSAEQNACRWALKITYESDGEVRAETIEDESFYFTSLARAQAFDLLAGKLEVGEPPQPTQEALCGHGS
jgi:hypothetical protein